MTDIQQLIDTQQYVLAIAELDEHISQNPLDDNAFYLRGNVYRKMNRFGDALNDYHKAVELNAQSPAAIAIEIINDIMDFRHVDLLNP